MLLEIYGYALTPMSDLMSMINRDAYQERDIHRSVDYGIYYSL